MKSGDSHKDIPERIVALEFDRLGQEAVLTPLGQGNQLWTLAQPFTKSYIHWIMAGPYEVFWNSRSVPFTTVDSSEKCSRLNRTNG